MNAEQPKIVLVIEYDGTCYCGYQFQVNSPTIQNEIEQAILKLTGEKLRVVASSRTDSGVHARGQVVCFRTKSKLEPETIKKGLNFYLPQDIAVKETRRVLIKAASGVNAGELYKAAAALRNAGFIAEIDLDGGKYDLILEIMSDKTMTLIDGSKQTPVNTVADVIKLLEAKGGA